MNLKGFGEQLQTLRKQAGLSQERLVEALDQRAHLGPAAEQRVIDSTLLSRWEHARTQAGRQWKPTRAYVLHLIHIFAHHLQLETAQRWAAQAGYQITAAELSALFPEAAAVATVQPAQEQVNGKTPMLLPPNNLPAALTSFVGRQREVAQLTSYLLNPTTRLLTIVGEGGVGKSRLALTVAQQLVDLQTSQPPKFPDGVWFVPLAGLEGNPVASVTANRLATAIAKSVNFAFAGGDVEPATQLIAFLHSRTMLLILDNFEHLTAGASFVVDLLQQAAQVSVLVTARGPLNVQAEQLLWLEGLSLTSTATEPAPGVQLFSERTRQQLPDFTVDEQTVQAILQLCQFFDGNPLAIELAAHWMQHYRLGEMIALLQQQHLAILETDQQDVPLRHRTMAAVFETSWQLLSPNQQATLAQITVFRGPFTREAAAAVTDATLPTLAALVNSSLLRQVCDAAGGVAYAMHELLRQFAARKLSTDEQTQRVQHRHSDYYLQLLATHGPTLYGQAMKSALAELQTNIDNIRVAWQWAVNHGNVAMLGTAWFGLRAFYHVRSLHQEGEAVFRSAAAHLQSLSSASAGAAALAAELEIAQAFFLNQLHRYEEAMAVASRVLAALPEPQATPTGARALLEWGIGLSLRSQHDAALTKLTEAATVARTLALPAVEARALHAMNRNLWAKGAFAQADAALERALYGYRQVGYRLAEGFVLRALGHNAYLAGRYAEALAHLEATLALYQEAEDQPRIISLWKHLGDVYAALGDWGRAYHYYQAAYTDSDEAQDLRHTANTLVGYGRLLGALGDYPAAIHHCEQALQQQRQMGYGGGIIEVLCTLGWVQHKRGSAALALAAYRQAAALIETGRDQLYKGATLQGIGQALATLGAWDEAKIAYEEALAIQRKLGQQPAVVETSCALARLALAQAQVAEAVALVDEILAGRDPDSLPDGNEPLLCALSCYQVLQANGDNRAQPLLRTAYAHLQSQAATIPDADLRRSFLENVAVNRVIWAEYHSQNALRGTQKSVTG
jgi:predicted ATPase/transcriptional regulator with XRE-family HTH domain